MHSASDMDKFYDPEHRVIVQLIKTVTYL